MLSMHSWKLKYASVSTSLLQYPLATYGSTSLTMLKLRSFPALKAIFKLGLKKLLFRPCGFNGPAAGGLLAV